MNHLRYAILKQLATNNNASILTAVSAKTISENIPDKKLITVQKEIRSLLADGLLDKGMSNGRAYSYYITKAGANCVEKIEQNKSKAKIITAARATEGTDSSTAIINMANKYNDLGYKVLCILNVDEKIKSMLDINLTQIDSSFLDLLNSIRPDCSISKDYIESAIIHSRSIDIIQISTINNPARYDKRNHIEAFHNIIDILSKNYDYIFIDNIDDTTLKCALACSDSVLVPCHLMNIGTSTELTHILHTINDVKESLNPHLKLDGIYLAIDQNNVNTYF